jgi:hypothetical protein
LQVCWFPALCFQHRNTNQIVGDSFTKRDIKYITWKKFKELNDIPLTKLNGSPNLSRYGGALERLKQEVYKFKASQGFVVIPWSQKKKKIDVGVGVGV